MRIKKMFLATAQVVPAATAMAFPQHSAKDTAGDAEFDNVYFYFDNSELSKIVKGNFDTKR
jgi:hypothetical protein